MLIVPEHTCSPGVVVADCRALVQLLLLLPWLLLAALPVARSVRHRVQGRAGPAIKHAVRMRHRHTKQGHHMLTANTAPSLVQIQNRRATGSTGAQHESWYRQAGHCSPVKGSLTAATGPRQTWEAPAAHAAPHGAPAVRQAQVPPRAGQGDRPSLSCACRCAHRGDAATAGACLRGVTPPARRLSAAALREGLGLVWVLMRAAPAYKES